ncbi:hypothetical protein PVAP13_2KG024400 [Panicum virgatum]|uniref:Rx N-terminal domain-containing protein n=1 Tax=Panicum virgatum TaxID=38727 RepID=A0A8T0VX25_PANVG|nr:hypothetical protein PVAP13_2KG024400 [Panicum virgatum]
MAEIVTSAVVQETVSQVLSGLVKKYEKKEESNVIRNLERLEIAHMRLEAALETSEKWQITDVSLLRWHRKLKCVAQECDEMLHKGKLRILEDELMEQEVRSASIAKRFVHATKSFVSSVLNCNSNKLSRSITQRFEWYADGASEFLRFIQFGGTPRCHMPFHSLVKNLFAGKELHHKIFRIIEYPSFQFSLVPIISPVLGIEAILVLIQNDGTPEGNIYFRITVQLSECTDILGITIRCLQLFAPHVKCTVENIRNELIQLLPQDLSWMPSVYSYQKEQLHFQILGSQWLRPNPLCCKQHFFLEPVLEVNLQCHVSLSVSNKQKTLLSQNVISLQDSPYLKAGIHFAPHRSPKDMLPANRSSEVLAIVGEDQHCLRVDVTLEQLEEIMIPKAIDYFYQNTEATIYKMIWRLNIALHLLRKRKLLQGQEEQLISERCMISHLFDLWSAHVPVQLISAFKDCGCRRKGKLVGPQQYLKF